MSNARAAAAGAGAALAWAALEPLDKRLFRLDYSDVALLGKLVTRSRWWPAAGLALHLANGAAFGLRSTRRAAEPTRRRATRRLAGARRELRDVSARLPARAVASGSGQPGLAPFWNVRGLTQATARHGLFGIVLGRLAR